MNAGAHRVSVIIPLYGGEEFVLDAIASVLLQDGAAIDVIVVDDASPDSSATRVASLGDERVRLLRHDHNRGIAAARNTGLRAARGEFVAFLDQDDLWTPGRLSAQLRAWAQHAGADIGVVFGRVALQDEAGRVVPDRRRVPRDVHRIDRGALLRGLIADNFVTLASALIQKRVIDATGPFDEAIRGGSDDFDMVIRLAETCRFAFAPEVALVRRLHGENFTSSLRMTEESLAVIDRAVARHEGLAAAARVGRARKLYRRGTDLFIAGERARAAADYRRAVREWPWHLRAWVGWAACRLGVDGGAMWSAWRRVRRRRRLR
ncbi:MAG TPA: glycosyltransferase family 2 protein [Candidatus Krumholzibacteria bacterium]|nr:glycosyltransferase family 2 protein [Candidatus Krumholzibacteria bacterium]